MADEKTRLISDLLRSADKIIKDGKLDDALNVINKVFDIDARNVYARAYQERILSLKDAKAKETKAKEAAAPPPPEPRPAAPPSRTATAAPTITAQPQKTSPAVTGPIKRTPAALEAYRTLLEEIWIDGSVSEPEQSRIASMRETFAITTEEHERIDKHVRAECYLSAIRDAWEKGITNFEGLRKQYRITDQEHIEIEPKVLELLQSLHSKGSVLVLDDEEPFLNSIKDYLDQNGYFCYTSLSGEDGLQLLETISPDIILCDINFTRPQMSGFTFYEKIRTQDRLVNVPFIFISGMDQHVLIRTGKQMGVDDYLTKPVDLELLLATIEGKIRRYREIRRHAAHRS